MNAYLPTEQQLNELVTLKTICDVNMELVLENPRGRTTWSEHKAIVSVWKEQLTLLNKVSQKCRVICHTEGLDGFLRMRDQLMNIHTGLSTLMKPKKEFSHGSIRKDIWTENGVPSPSIYESAEFKEMF